jgi:mono/diheme cytochrome c family protein
MGKVTATAGAKSASADVVITAYTAAQYTAGQTKYMASCAGCHSGAGGVDHSPTILEFNPDQELLLAITTGAYSDGYKLRAPNHAFMLTDAEKGGIVAYIRSLPPKDFQP